jgi:hypothetical protein
MGRKRRPGEAWEYRTSAGVLFFCPAEELYAPIRDLLLKGALPAWELESALAAEFRITDRERKAVLANGHYAWENHVAWALSHM